MISSLENSLSFSWNKYQPCISESQDSIQVSYEFELRRLIDSSIVHSGNELNLNISFNTLEVNTFYSMRVRVSTVSSSTGRRGFSSWSSYVYVTTMSIQDTTKPPTTTASRSSFAYRTTAPVKSTRTPIFTTVSQSSFARRTTSPVRATMTATTTTSSRGRFPYGGTMMSVELETQSAAQPDGMYGICYLRTRFTKLTN